MLYYPCYLTYFLVMDRDVESRVKISWNQFHEIFREIDFKNFF